jgi:hypothetical protein
MVRTFDYIMVTLLSIALVLILVKPMVEAAAESIITSANLIQEAIEGPSHER